MIYIIIGPPYDPIIPRIAPIFYLYLILFPVTFILALKLIKKGIYQQSKSAKFLGISFMFYGIGILIAFIGLLEVMITNEFREIYRISLPVGYSAGIVGNIFLLYFGYSLFGFQKKMIFIFKFWTIFTIFLVNLDNNWYGVPNFVYEGQFSLRVYSSLNMTILSFTICIYLIHKLKSLKSKDKIKEFGFRLIIWSFGSFIMFWVCMTLDALNIIFSGEGFSTFTLIAWLFAALFWILSYNGLLMPPRLRKILESR
jgi:hypothetical protein